jgi:flagellar biosynthesis/type III secretory pathway protein FliH
MHQRSNAGAGFFAMLEMIARTPDQLLEYDTSLKAQRDAEARISYAQQAGIEIGEARGEARGLEQGLLRGQIILLLQLLQQPVWTDDQFASCDSQQLGHMIADLRQRLKIGGR